MSSLTSTVTLDVSDCHRLECVSWVIGGRMRKAELLQAAHGTVRHEGLRPDDRRRDHGTGGIQPSALSSATSPNKREMLFGGSEMLQDALVTAMESAPTPPTPSIRWHGSCGWGTSSSTVTIRDSGRRSVYSARRTARARVDRVGVVVRCAESCVAVGFGTGRHLERTQVSPCSRWR